MKALKAFMKPFEALLRSAKIKFKLIFSLCPGSGREGLNSEIIDGKAFETLIITSIRTLKLGRTKRGREKVSKLDNNSLCNEFCKDLYKKILDNLIENHSVNCHIVNSRECLSLLKRSELNHRPTES